LAPLIATGDVIISGGTARACLSRKAQGVRGRAKKPEWELRRASKTQRSRHTGRTRMKLARLKTALSRGSDGARTRSSLERQKRTARPRGQADEADGIR
jgi:hypothetical protein